MRKHTLKKALPLVLLFLSFKMHASGLKSPSESFSSSARCLALSAYKEARGEPSRGQEAVMHVVLNRASIYKLPVCSVLKQRGQFSWYSSPASLRGKVPSGFLTRAQEMLTIERLGMREDITKGATHFTRRNIKARWMRRMRVTVVIGHHKFLKGRG